MPSQTETPGGAIWASFSVDKAEDQYGGEILRTRECATRKATFAEGVKLTGRVLRITTKEEDSHETLQFEMKLTGIDQAEIRLLLPPGGVNRTV